MYKHCCICSIYKVFCSMHFPLHGHEYVKNDCSVDYYYYIHVAICLALNGKDLVQQIPSTT